MAEHNEIGKRGEALAQNFLVKKGYKLIDLNWRYRHLEIDIVAEIDDELVIVEVKTLRGDYFQLPEEQVSKKKIRHIIDATEAYILKKDIHRDVRFDVVSVLLKWNGKVEIEHFEDAFLPPVM